MYKILWVATMLLRISGRNKALTAQKNSPRLISGALLFYASFLTAS